MSGSATVDFIFTTRYSGTVVQWYTGTVVQCYSGTLVQWYSSTVWYSGFHLYKVHPLLEIRLTARCPTTARRLKSPENSKMFSTLILKKGK